MTKQNTILLRPTTKKDVSKICKLMLPFPDLYAEYYVNSKKRGGIKWLLKYALKAGDEYDAKSYVAELDGKIVGHIAYYKDIHCFQGGVYGIRALVVDKNKRGKGYSKILIRHIENELKKIDARIAWMQTDKKSHKYYLSQKYFLVCIFKNFWGKGLDRYVLSKNF